AKKYNSITSFGKILDPIADKFLTLAAFLIFVYMGLIESWMVFFILVREVGVTFSRLRATLHGHVLAAESAGKLKTVTQIVTISFILAFLLLREWASINSSVGNFWNAGGPYWMSLIQVLMVVTLLLTVISGVMYFQSKKRQDV
ncbi:MAG: CDP-diacylglycerol--glycerol-3-phosphate 3-phosphatidyltransferase, partial [Candidatus Omnitrophica bacterium]|nr:CDP-diacylglycerol--glycerol-3-phosphate 3-phosphatidyltransferase [Candidatus Omnitrophota bacterium]